MKYGSQQDDISSLFSSQYYSNAKSIYIPTNISKHIDYYLLLSYNLSMQIEWKLVAIKQIKKIPNPDQKRIFTQVDSLEAGLEGKSNIKKLINHQYDFRLRVGKYRVLFNVH